MKTKLMFAVMMLASVSAWADAPITQIPIAKCRFEMDYGKTRRECRAVASICLSKIRPAEARPGEQCMQDLMVECDGHKIFEGQWKQGYQEQPERLFINALSNDRYWEIPRITIAPDLEKKNPSVLRLDEETLDGQCELTLPNEGRLPLVFGQF